MRTLEEIAGALKESKLEEVAVETGFSYFTLVRYRRGDVKHPPHDSIKRLSAWMDARERASAKRHAGRK